LLLNDSTDIELYFTDIIDCCNKTKKFFLVFIHFFLLNILIKDNYNIITDMINIAN